MWKVSFGYLLLYIKAKSWKSYVASTLHNQGLDKYQFLIKNQLVFNSYRILSTFLLKSNGNEWENSMLKWCPHPFFQFFLFFASFSLLSLWNYRKFLALTKTRELLFLKNRSQNTISGRCTIYAKGEFIFLHGYFACVSSLKFIY